MRFKKLIWWNPYPDEIKNQIINYDNASLGLFGSARRLSFFVMIASAIFSIIVYYSISILPPDGALYYSDPVFNSSLPFQARFADFLGGSLGTALDPFSYFMTAGPVDLHSINMSYVILNNLFLIILGIFLYKANQYFILISMAAWTSEFFVKLYIKPVSIIPAAFNWCFFMSIFYLAYRTEIERNKQKQQGNVL